MGRFIGITLSFDNETHELRHDYVRAVEEAGGVPVLLPAIEHDDGARELVDRLDALVVTGGPAVTDGLLGELPADLAETHPHRERFDRKITSSFLGSRKPVLGICYGMQLLNALDGGTIYADVERQLEGALPHSPKRGGSDHSIRIHESTHLFEILGTRTATVNSRHIQAIAKVGPRFRVSATAPDGVIEAIETPDGAVLGVQFHPERMGMGALFEGLVSRCGRDR